MHHRYEVDRKAELGEGDALWRGPGEGLIVAGYRRDHEQVDPPLDYPDYRGTLSRHPKRPLVPIPDQLTEVTGPLLGEDRIGEVDNDLTVGHGGTPQGQMMVLHGRVLDGDGRPSAARSSRSGRRTPPAATGTPGTATRRRSTRTSRASGAA